jgi:hypothetical protein
MISVPYRSSIKPAKIRGHLTLLKGCVEWCSNKDLVDKFQRMELYTV